MWSQGIIMKMGFNLLVLSLAAVGTALAHHGVPAEYGDSSQPTSYVEGTIVKVMWRNPHIFINIRSTGGDVPADENWRLTTHPVHIMEGTYEMEKEQFVEGAAVRVHGWKHIHGQPLMQIRAIQVDDGPMRSTLRFADLRDVLSDELKSSGIQPAATLDGSDPGRLGKDIVERLKEIGWVGEDGMVTVPEGYFDPT